MTPRIAKHKIRALTWIEVLVIIVVLAIAAAMLFPVREAAPRRAARINCVDNLTLLNLAMRIWEGDHNNEYPMSAFVTNGGTMELNKGQNAWAWVNFVPMSNAPTPQVLHCPADTERPAATSFSDLNGKISYFVSLDGNKGYPQMIMDGDDNLAINGVPVKSGLLKLPDSARLS